MLRLRFYTPEQESPGAVETGAFFRAIGSMLCRGAGNEPVATWLKVWKLGDTDFTRAEALEPVVIYFENNAGLASSAYGPFESLQLNEGAAWAGSRLIARLDEKSQLWYPPKALDGWASLLIAPPGRSRFDLVGDRPSA